MFTCLHSDCNIRTTRTDFLSVKTKIGNGIMAKRRKQKNKKMMKKLKNPPLPLKLSRLQLRKGMVTSILEKKRYRFHWIHYLLIGGYHEVPKREKNLPVPKGMMMKMKKKRRKRKKMDLAETSKIIWMMLVSKWTVQLIFRWDILDTIWAKKLDK